MRAITPAYTTAGNTSTNTRTAPADGAASIHLDALRGVAAFWVFLSHWRDCLFVDYPDVHPHHLLMGAGYLSTGLGHQWVVVFFVLSGYLVGGSVLRQMATDRWSLGGYALKRLTRLYAVLIPALILGGLFDLLGLRLFGTTGDIWRADGSPRDSSQCRLQTDAANCSRELCVSPIHLCSFPGIERAAVES